MNLLSPLRRAVSVAGGREAIVGQGAATYAQMWARCRRLTGALSALSLERGDRVAVAAANSRAYLELHQTVPGAGYVLVPLNTRHTQAELGYALTDSGTSVLFTDLDPEPFAGVVKRVISLPGEYEDLLAGATEQEPPDGIAEDDLAGLFYTGGTTGAAKGVMLTHRNLVANAFHFMACWPFTAETRWLVAAPMFHAAGTIGVLSIVWNGGSHVVLERFDPAVALDLIEEHRVTARLVVPTMMAALAAEQRRRPRDVSSLTHLSYGGSPSRTETLRQARAAFPGATLLHIYGATETSPIVTLLPGQEHVLDSPRVRSCGQPAVGVEVRTVDPDGRPVPTGTVGEVITRGPNVMAGCWNMPEETARALRDGWYWTGDLAYMDDEAYVFHVDRSEDMIVTGGENVYSSEVENALAQHPAVVEVAVFGVPDARWGEAVHAALAVREPVDEDALRAHCRALIADCKVPKTFEFHDTLPKSGAGKILKRELRRPHWADGDRFVAGGSWQPSRPRAQKSGYLRAVSPARPVVLQAHRGHGITTGRAQARSTTVGLAGGRGCAGDGGFRPGVAGVGGGDDAGAVRDRAVAVVEVGEGDDLDVAAVEGGAPFPGLPAVAGHPDLAAIGGAAGQVAVVVLDEVEGAEGSRRLECPAPRASAVVGGQQDVATVGGMGRAVPRVRNETSRS